MVLRLSCCCLLCCVDPLTDFRTLASRDAASSPTSMLRFMTSSLLLVGGGLGDTSSLGAGRGARPASAGGDDLLLVVLATLCRRRACAARATLSCFAPPLPYMLLMLLTCYYKLVAAYLINLFCTEDADGLSCEKKRSRARGGIGKLLSCSRYDIF